MVEVNLWSGLGRFTDGQLVIEIDAMNVGEVLDGLVHAYPDMKEIIDAGVSVAVDGRMVASSRTYPVRPDSEVFIIQQLKGG